MDSEEQLDLMILAVAVLQKNKSMGMGTKYIQKS